MSLNRSHGMKLRSSSLACPGLFGPLPLGRLDWVLCSSAQLIEWLSKFTLVSAYMCDALHWLSTDGYHNALPIWFSWLHLTCLCNLCCPVLLRCSVFGTLLCNESRASSASRLLRY